MTDELHDACAKGNLEQVKDLVENKGADVNQPHSVHLTYPIYFAAAKGHLAIIKYLISKSAKASDTNNAYGNLLYWACRCQVINEREAILNHIYQNFAEYHFLDGTTKTHVAAARLNHLVEFNGQISDLLVPNNDGVTPFYFALLRCPQEVIKKMSVKKINFNQIIIKPADMPNPDSWHRNYLLLMRSVMDIFISNQMFEQAVEVSALYLANCNQIRNKTENDNIELDLSYRVIGNIFCHIGASHYSNKEYQQAIVAYKNAITAGEKIKSKTESDHKNMDNKLDLCYRNIAGSYHYIGDAHLKQKKYQQTIEAYNAAIAAGEKIKSKTEKDHRDLDIFYRKVAESYYHIYLTHNQQLNDPQEIDVLTCRLEALEKIKQKTDDEYRQISFILYRVGSRYLSPWEDNKTQEPAICFQEAVTALMNIQNATPKDYVSITHIYLNWSNCYLQYTVAWHLMELAKHIFSPSPLGNATVTEFLLIYGEIVSVRNWQTLTHLIPLLIQIMELLLNGCRNQHFPNSQLKRFLLEKEDNRVSFQSKLVELKELPQLSLENILMQNVSPVIELANRVLALTAKANAMEIVVQAQNEKIQALQAELAQLKQGATVVTENNNNTSNNNNANDNNGSNVNSNSNNNANIDNNGSSPDNNKTAKTPLLQRDSPVLAANNDKAKATPLRIKLKRKPQGDTTARVQYAKKSCVDNHAPETTGPKSLK